MAIKELFQDSRPQVLFDPRASQRIDPRFKFTRDGTATYYDKDGVLRYAAANEPRFDRDPVTKKSLGLLVEEERENLFTYGTTLVTNWTAANVTLTASAATSPDGTLNAIKVIPTTVVSSSHYTQQTVTTTSISTFSVYAKADGYNYLQLWSTQGSAIFNLSDGTYTLIAGPLTAAATLIGNGWYRLTLSGHGATSSQWRFYVYPTSSHTTAYAGDGNSGVLLWGAQLEEGTFPTSFIRTTSSTVTREPDLLSIEGTSLPSTGSIYIDARSLSSNVDDTLLSAANASDDKLTLAIRQPASLYDSKALVYEVDGEFRPTLPFPVPSNVRERNLITYGTNNYHYRSDSSRLTPSSSTSVPANMNRLGIGHDVTDPTKAITGYINTVYLWPGEITPTVAEALVRGDLDPKDADTGVFTPETGALAFVFNTQGTATDGDRVVELPVSGSTNNILVDWGDNTSSSFIGAAANSTVSHTYSAAGIYPVQITADDDGTNSALETLNFYNSSQRNDLVRVLQWGGTTTWQPTTMYRAFRDCTQLDFENAARTGLPDTSAVTNWQEAFYNCSSISGTFPTFDTTAATTFNNTWRSCSSLTAFPFIESASVTNMQQAWQGCSSLNSFPLIDTSAATNLSLAWSTCSSLTSFPLINTSSATTLEQGWTNCTALTAFPLIDTANVTNMNNAWNNCGELTTFPPINTSSVVNMSGTWMRCRKMTSFPLINTANVTNMGNAWYECETLASMPLIDTSKVTNLSGAWTECFALTSFPLINTAACTNFSGAWYNCSSLTSFPLINTAAGTSFSQAWLSCSSLTSFPLINTAAGTNFSSAWYNCSSLTSFPLINTAAGTNFSQAWNGCSSLTSFPLIDTSSGTNFVYTWQNCSSLTSFPTLSIDNSTVFGSAWRNCSSLTSFPANYFDTWTGTPGVNCFSGTWNGCNSLDPASVVGILESIAASGQSAPTSATASHKHITIDWDGTGDPATDAATAINTLKSRSWIIVLNGVTQ